MPGTGEIIVLFLVVLLLFGPRRLPEIARTIGKVFDQLRKASQDFRDQVMRLDDGDMSDTTDYSELDDRGDTGRIEEADVSIDLETGDESASDGSHGQK